MLILGYHCHMPLECNIDRKGRLIRGIMGIVFLGAALTLIFLTPPTGVRRLVVVLLAFVGIFTIYEAVRGWCILRAMGRKTRF